MSKISKDWPILGHKKIISYLQETLRNKNISHAYLFSGPSHIGKTTLVKIFAKTLQCQKEGLFPCERCQNCQLIKKNINPDTIYLEGEKNIKIEEIREIQHKLSLSHFSCPYKIVIITQAQRMTLEAANCLLKTLEEPPPKTVLILISPQINTLLPTIRSRCQIIKMQPVASKEIKKYLSSLVKEKKEVEYLVGMANGRPGVALEILAYPEILAKQTEIIDKLILLPNQSVAIRLNFASFLLSSELDIESILDFWLYFLHELIFFYFNNLPHSPFRQQFESWLATQSVSKIKTLLEEIIWAKEKLKTNVNPRLALENLILSI